MAKETLRVPLSELPYQAEGIFFAILTERRAGKTREGKLYYSCRIRDRHRQASFMVWENSPYFETCRDSWSEGKFFKIKGTLYHHEKYGLQLDVGLIRPVEDRDREDGFSEADFQQVLPIAPEQLFEELVQLAELEINLEPLCRLVLTLLNQHKSKLLQLPATPRHYYIHAGGWLEHTLAVTKNVLLLADRYIRQYPLLKPPLNRNLLVAGAILHEIGRAVELEPPAKMLEPFDYSIPGRLLGHLILGRDLVREAAKAQGDLSGELITLLEHMLLSHLALPEWGSPRLPLIPEVLILHHADDLDAKMEMFTRCLIQDTSQGPFTERDPILGRNLLKQREQ